MLNDQDFGTDAALRRSQYSTLLIIQTIIYTYIIYTATNNTFLECIIGSKRNPIPFGNYPLRLV